MAGYYFYSMSNNALDAYRRGEMPMSKWTKKAILQRLEEQFEIKEEHLAFFRSLSLRCLREKLLVECDLGILVNKLKLVSVACNHGTAADDDTVVLIAVVATHDALLIHLNVPVTTIGN